MPNEDKGEVKGPDFVIVDRRAREPESEQPAPAEPAKPPAAEEPPAAAAADEPQAAEEPAGEAGPEAEVADVYSTIGFVITLLHEQAWHLLGLVPHPITQKYNKDLEQAQVAIDSVAFLVGKLEGKLAPDEMRRLRSLVADLQLNFAKQKAAPPS
jgi:hypothetical protein